MPYYLLCALVACVSFLFATPPPKDSPLSAREWKLCEQFIRKKAQAIFSTGQYYIPEQKALPCPVEKDPISGYIFIHLKDKKGGYIGKGHNKVVTKSILYGSHPKVVARCEGGLPTYEEANVLQQLVGLSGVVQYITLIRREQNIRGDLFLEYYNQGSLKSALEKQRKFTTKELLQIMSDLLIGLSGIHTRGFIHRDIHHGNIVLGKKNGQIRAALADFGLSIGVKDRMEVRPIVPNSACPPEFLLHEFALIDRLKSESYSIGIIFYELLEGKKPPWAKILNPNRIPDYTPETRQKVYDTIIATYYSWRHKTLSSRRTARDILKWLTFDLLQPEPLKRTSIQQALKIVTKLQKSK